MPSIPGVGGLPGGGTVTYDIMKSKYANFEFPQARIEFNGKSFAESQSDMVINDISVELSCGFEASAARLRIYNSYDNSTGEFKFDQLKELVLLGSTLRVMLGYLNKLELVFVGFVAGIDFAYDGINQPYIEVTGMDAKGLMMSSAYAAQLTAKSYGEAVAEVLKRMPFCKVNIPDLGVPASPGDADDQIIYKVSVADTPDKQIGGGGVQKASAETIEMVSESDYEFIVKAAKKFNYEFFIDRGEVIFRKAKSVTGSLTRLAVNSGILTFDLGYSLTGMVETIEVRSMDAGKGKVVSSKTKNRNKLSTANKAAKLLRGSKKVYIDPTVFSQAQADARRDYLLEQMSYRLGSLECECIGLPDLVPGRFVDISVGAPADNRFYITNVVHEVLSSGAYRTRLVGRVSEVQTGGLANVAI